MEQKPSVGRMVHYVSEQGECQAAVISGVARDDESAVHLHVFDPVVAVNVKYSIQSDQGQGIGTWHWPERV
jgi:hypothetical protein